MVDEAWLNTVRIARDCGNISSLFPDGIARLWDLPHTLHTAVRMALYFLKFEEIPHDEDRPPKKYWLDADRMKQWWTEVRQAQEERAKGGTATRDMPQNAVLKEIFPGMKIG